MDADVQLKGVFLRTAPDGEEAMTPLQPTGADTVCQWWEARIALQMPRTNYRFWLLTEAGGWWLTAAGLSRHTPPDAYNYVLLADPQSPPWLQETVFYQIFPDRFADGDPANNVRTGEYLAYGQPVFARRWGEEPQPEQGAREFFGGDLQGVAQRLDYIADLGANAIYLNPIFTAPSSHKYDAVSYTAVDPHLGGDAALAELRRRLDAHAMRLVLDFVPNHCGAEHPWFVAAQADPRAPSAEFFSFSRHPDEYASWLGHRKLPRLNYRSQRLRDLMYAGPDAAMRCWLRPPYRIDGWRVDVANMLGRQGMDQLGHEVAAEMRRAVKAEAPEAYLLAEHFFDATPELQGDAWDAAMNYRGFLQPLLQWLSPHGSGIASRPPWGDTAPLPSEALAAQWRAFLAAIPWQIARQQFNTLGTHDTPRITSLLHGDVARLTLAITLLMTFPGVPSIFYGDEIGLAGMGDPANRRCMEWEPRRWNHELRDRYRTLIRLRRSAPALISGGFQLLHTARELIAYLREAPGQRIIVVVRRGADDVLELPVRHGGIADGMRFRELWSGAIQSVRGGHLTLAGLPDIGAQVWIWDEALEQEAN